MLIVTVFGIWLGIVALVVIAFEAIPEYLSNWQRKRDEKNERVITDEEVMRGIAAYRNLKKIEFGLNMVSNREVRVDRPRGAHRRLQAS